LVQAKKEAAFLKKGDAPCGRRKKLLLSWVMGFGSANAHCPANKSLFGSFSSEKEPLPSLA
jgi:hypothetical protein